MKRRGRRAGVLLTLVGAVLGLHALVWWGPPNPVRRLINSIELSLYDAQVRDLPNRAPDSRIVIVGMDDATLDKIRPPLERPFYPLPRAYHARLIENLFRAGAKVIALDIIFATPRPEPDEDPALALALRHHGNVLAALVPDVSLVGGVERATFAPPAPVLAPHLVAASILVPRPVRWIDPYRTDDSRLGVRYGHIGFAAAAAYQGEVATTPTLRDTFHWGHHIDAPVTSLVGGDDNGQVLLRPVGPTGHFPVVPYYEVHNDTWRRHYPSDFFRGKIVYVGRISPLEDRHQTAKGEVAGVEVLATVTQMALTNDYLRAGGALDTLLVGIALMGLYLLVLWRWSILPAALVALVTALLWAATPRWLLLHHALWVETTPPLLLLALTVAGASVYEAGRMRGQLGRFMPSWVASRVLAGEGGAVSAPGTLRPVTVVFCDIRSFTLLSEQYPQASVEILRRFFEAGDRLARQFGTELDKYVGDEMMLYFFDRRGKPPHPLRAAQWAGAMQAEIARIDQSGIAGEVGFRAGVGIATGEAYEGFVGAAGRMQSTVIGDVVNTASRLQDATKQLGRPIVMNEETYQAVRGQVGTEPLGEIAVKGKQGLVAVYALLPAPEAKKQG